MAITKLNSLAIPPDTVVESDISFPLDSASFTGDLTVDTDTLVVDSTNDLVGINVAAPADNFHVRVSDATLAAPNSRSVALFERNADAAITIGSNAANKGIIYFADSASATDGQIFYDHATQSMSIGTAGAVDRVVVNADGTVDFNRRVDIEGITSGSYLVCDDGTNGRFQINPTSASEVSLYGATTGFSGWGSLNFKGTHHIMTYGPGAGTELARFDLDGLKFNGDTAAANALDDYEEGTWTPVAQNTANATSFTIINGIYTKVGRLMTVSAQVSFSVTSSTAETRFTLNLPVNAGSALHSSVGVFPFFVGSGADRFGMGVVYRGSNNSTLAYIYIPAREVQTTGSVEGRITFTYYTAT